MVIMIFLDSWGDGLIVHLLMESRAENVKNNKSIYLLSVLAKVGKKILKN